MMTELRSSVRSVPSRNRLAYCRNVKPLKLAMSVPVLNEATARTIIGIYRKMNTRTVTVRLKCFIPLHDLLSSLSPKRFMMATQIKIRIISTRLMAAPRFGL